MNEPAPMNAWLIEPFDSLVAAAIDRLRRADDVQRIAVMPDVHLAKDICVGTVIATRRLLYPGAVGGDIGCGMLAMAFDAPADILADPARAGKLLAAIQQAIPSLRRHRRRTFPYPDGVRQSPLSHPALEAIKLDEGSLQLGTLGGGNHFIELQSDEDNRLWLMIHSGSRAMGQAIRAHHSARARLVAGKLLALDLGDITGQEYLADMNWARRYADANRQTMAHAIAELLEDTLAIHRAPTPLIACDHNHVAIEQHGGQSLLVHRKGAMWAPAGMTGVVPGSMGTLSYHVEGRGCPQSINSSAHGAGRALSRQAARSQITLRALGRQMEGVWFDYRKAPSLREEAPSAYKDVRAVMRAQHDLVKILRTLRPILVYKA